MSEPVSNGATRLLVVDDEAGLVTALLSTLRENGYEAAGATTPADACACLRAQRFDIMLTDLHLPEMDGIALVRAALEIDPDLIAILMTGHGSIDTAVDAMKAGAVDYVLKPFKLRSVQVVIARALAVRKLRHENQALQRNLAARTHALEATNRELEAFSYSVSHDLRAPLRTIEGFTAALVEECAAGNTENVSDYGERIKRGVRRMGSMIDDLLRMAKTARTELACSEVNVSELCREIIQKLEVGAPGRAVEVSIADQMIVVADPGLLTIALENLLGNAWKYTGRQPVARIEVELERRPGEAIVSVKDNGVGFSPAEARDLFSPFQRLPSAADFEGTGVGLATVQRIMHRHGGRIWAEAEPGKGATFRFSLPQPE